MRAGRRHRLPGVHRRLRAGVRVRTWSGPTSAPRRSGWCGCCASCCPGHTELDALLALVLLQHSRRDARVRDGELVLLGQQDRSRWHTDEIDEALTLLRPLTDGPGRAVPAPGADRRRARDRLLRGGHRLEPDRGPLPRARGPHRLAGGPAQPGGRRRRGRRAARRAARCSTASTCRATGCPAYGPSCSAAPAGTPRRATSWTGRSRPATTSPSDATSSSDAQPSEHLPVRAKAALTPPRPRSTLNRPAAPMLLCALEALDEAPRLSAAPAHLLSCTTSGAAMRPRHSREGSRRLAVAAATILTLAATTTMPGAVATTARCLLAWCHW